VSNNPNPTSRPVLLPPLYFSLVSRERLRENGQQRVRQPRVRDARKVHDKHRGAVRLLRLSRRVVLLRVMPAGELEGAQAGVSRGGGGAQDDSARRAAPPPCPRSPSAGRVAVGRQRPPPAQVVEIMVSLARDVRVAREGCWFLADIPDSQRQAAVACGGVRAIVAALRAHAKDAEVAEAGCAALCSIASGPDALKQAVVDAGGVPAIIAALHAHSGVAAVAEQNCAALRNIARGPAALKQAIVDARGVPVIIAALHAHSGVAAVAETGCGALRSIASGPDALKQAIVDSGGQDFLSDGPPAQP